MSCAIRTHLPIQDALHESKDFRDETSGTDLTITPSANEQGSLCLLDLNLECYEALAFAFKQ